ncbi:MAG: hypothetical protein H0V81_07215, partial [Solirubrobacterales bacterium]|nr:hypothetical protein [Solirubrobacterales bacterium]
ADVEALSAKVQAQAGVTFGVDDSVAAGLKASLGGTRDREGNTTATFEITGTAAKTLARGLLAGGVSGEGSAVLSVVYDRAWKPTTLKVSMTGAAGGDGGAKAPGRAGGRGHGTLRSEITASLDLTDGDVNREAYHRMVSGLGTGRATEVAAAAGTLAARVASAGQLEVRRFTAFDRAYGADVEAALGGKLGAGVEVSRSSSQLDDAWTRPAGGAWVRRQDCLDAVARA